MQIDPKSGSSLTNSWVQSRPDHCACASLNSQVHQRGVDADPVPPHPFFPQTFSTSQAWGEHQITHQIEKCSNPGFEHSSAPMFNSRYPYRTPTDESQHVFGYESGHSTPIQLFGTMIGRDGSTKRSSNPQFIQHSAPPKFNPSYSYRSATEFQHKYGYGYGVGRGSLPLAPSQPPDSMRQCFKGPLDQRVRLRSNHWDHQLRSMTDPSFYGTFLAGSPALAIGPSGPEQYEHRPVFRNNIVMQGRDGLVPERAFFGRQMLERDNHYCHPFHPLEEGTVRSSPPHELNLIRGLEPKLGIGDDKPSILSSDASKLDPNMRCLSRENNGNGEFNSKSLDLTLRL
ncbi:hypothetical protein NE237_009812 [Protea cynaroides]|uniref:Uncharacterized protein n=1 Tax=Protea cynaroides TaxID=273540 RepID=A0A9Q0R105_9MAGN|nr:hypothetical protein NE237_009812 [Protea cynaroides]